MSGSASCFRLVKSYSFSHNPRKIQIHENPDSEITGKKKHYFKIKPGEGKDKTQRPKSSRRHFENRTDSRRILDPSLLQLYKKDFPNPNLHNLSREGNKSSGVLAPNSRNNLMYYESKTKEPKKVINLDKYKHFKFSYSEEELKRDSAIAKMHHKRSVFTNYANTTQIYSLPGGVKREVIGHRRNGSSITKKSADMKMKSVFCSKVACLPGTMTRNVDGELMMSTRRKCAKTANDECTQEMNWFRKPRQGCHRSGEESKEEKIVKEGKKHVKPERNEFRSTFSLG